MGVRGAFHPPSRADHDSSAVAARSRPSAFKISLRTLRSRPFVILAALALLVGALRHALRRASLSRAAVAIIIV